MDVTSQRKDRIMYLPELLESIKNRIDKQLESKKDRWFSKLISILIFFVIIVITYLCVFVVWVEDIIHKFSFAKTKKEKESI